MAKPAKTLSFSRRKIITLALLGITILVSYTFRNSIANLPMDLIIRADKPSLGADYIVLMMGDVAPRAHHAAELYHKGYSPKIIFAESEPSSMMQLGFHERDGKASHALLQKLRVPREAIIFLKDDSNSSSKEELASIFKYLKESGLETGRLILTTSWYHSSRATWIANRVKPKGYTIESAPSPPPANWWQKERDFLAVFNEWLKWCYYRIHY